MKAAMRLKTSSCFAALLAAAAVTGSADAQTTTSPAAATDQGSRGAPVEDAQVKDIIVTAQRRSESLQKTSVVVSVVDPGRLARAGVTQVQALTSIVPGLQIGNVGPVTQVYIRGVGDYGSLPISNPAVAFNVDGIYVGRSQSLISEFYDVDRVEVLKGPQGTLYGRNASGGAINLITASPSLSTVGGHVSAEFGNFNSQSFEAALNLPVSSTLGFRASGQIVSKGGFTSEHLSDDEHQSARLKALWRPSTDFSLLLNGSYGHAGGKGGSYVLVNRIPGTSKFLDIGSPQARAFIESRQFPGLPPGAVSGPVSSDAHQNMNFWNISAEANWNLGFAELTLLPAYRDARMSYTSFPSALYDSGAAFGPFAAHPETSRQTSVEARLSHNSDRFKWVVGGFFYDERQYSQYRIYFGYIQNVGVVSNLGTRSFAGFGQATYSIIPGIRLIGGARYTSDRRSLTDGASYALAPFRLLEDYAGRKTFRNVSWKAGVEADLSPDTLFFATASSGFKAGGFNQLVSLTAPVGSNAASSFKPEKLTAYEAGIKSKLFDRRLQLNVEGFHWDYKDHQEPHVALSGRGVTSLAFENAGNATIYGGSADLLVRPYRNGTFHAGIEFVHSKYDEFTFLQTAAFLLPGTTSCAIRPTTIVSQVGPVVQVDCSGRQVARSPKWSGNVGYTQIFELPGGDAIDATADLVFASRRWLVTDYLPIEHASAYATIDASLTYRTASRISLTAFVRNLTNQAVYTGGQQAQFSPGVLAASVGAPRTYGVRAAYRF